MSMFDTFSSNDSAYRILPVATRFGSVVEEHLLTRDRLKGLCRKVGTYRERLLAMEITGIVGGARVRRALLGVKVPLSK